MKIGGYHFDLYAGLGYVSAPAFAAAFAVFGHKWFLIAAAISIAAGALRSTISQQNIPPKSIPVGTPVTNGNKEQVGVITDYGIRSTPNGGPHA